MDRPLRPLFPDGFKKDTQIIATVLSSDKQNKADVLALTGASAALHISDIPWSGQKSTTWKRFQANSRLKLQMKREEQNR